MKADQLYRTIRERLAPALKAEGYRRNRAGMLGWYKAMANCFIVTWYQVSRDGWDDYAGSKFVLEFCVSDIPEPGGRGFRYRVPHFMTDPELGEALERQNRVVASLSRPPEGHWILEDPGLRPWYLGKFAPRTEPYSTTSDIWFRYHQPSHAIAWAEFLNPIQLRTLRQLEEHLSPI